MVGVTYKKDCGCSPRIDDTFIKGGYHVVKDIEERDTIPCCYRKKGMIAMVVDDLIPFTEYILNSNVCKKNIWDKVNYGTGGSSLWGEINGNIEDQTDLWSYLSNIPTDIMDLTDVSNLLFSGDYNDLTNIPTIPQQINLIEGNNINLSGTYPNITVEAIVPTLISELSNDIGYITSFTETDPTVPSHVKNISTGNITSWNNKLSNITGLIQSGNYITITGSGTSGSPYIVNANDMSSINEIIRTWISPPYIDIETKEYPGIVMTENCNLKSVVVTSTIAPTGSDIDVSIWRRGSMSAMTNVIIPIGSHISNPALLVAGNSFNAGQELYFVVNQKGSTIAGQGLQSKLGIEKI